MNVPFHPYNIFIPGTVLVVNCRCAARFLASSERAPWGSIAPWVPLAPPFLTSLPTSSRHPAHNLHLLCLLGAAPLCASGLPDRRSQCSPSLPSPATLMTSSPLLGSEGTRPGWQP